MSLVIIRFLGYTGKFLLESLYYNLCRYTYSLGANVEYKFTFAMNNSRFLYHGF